MKIQVEYAAQIKRAAGLSAETFEWESPCTVQDVLNRVVEKHGEPMQQLLFDANRQLHPSILLFIGDTQVRSDQHRQLRDGDVLTILSPISGG